MQLSWVALQPDVVLAAMAPPRWGPLWPAEHADCADRVPGMGDPVAAGYVESLARPGGNVTGFMNYEYSLAAKWLELLKEMVPTLNRVAVLRNATTPTGPAQFGVIQAVSPYLKVDVTALNIRNADDFEPAITGFARGPNDGLIVAASALAATHRHHFLEVVARHKLPAIYEQGIFVADGGLMSFAPNLIDQFRRAAGYVDRILKGEKPADLPVQAADQVRAGHQPQDREGARPRRAADAARPRRRGDRVRALFAAVHGSGSGTKRRTAASHQFGRYQRHSGHAAKSSGASIRRF